MTPPSMPPQITMNDGARRVSDDELPDRRLGSALRAAGHDIAQKIDAVRCPVHKRAATTGADPLRPLGQRGPPVRLVLREAG